MFQEKQLKYQDLLTTDNLYRRKFLHPPQYCGVLLSFIQNASIPLENFKIIGIILLPWASQTGPTRRPNQDAILPLAYFTLGRSTADNYWDVFLSHNVGHFNVCNILSICNGDQHHPFGGLLLSLDPLLQPVWQGQPYQSLHTWQHSSQYHKEALPTCQDHIIPMECDK